MDVDELRKKAWLCSLDGEYDEALSILESLLERDANDLVSLRLLGNTLDLFAASSECAGESGDDAVEAASTRAQECYRRILAIDPHNKHAIRDLADSFIARNDYNSAKELYDHLAGVVDPDSSADKEELAELAEALEELSKCSQGAAKRNPG